MSKTKKITISAMMTALGVALMTFGYFIEAFDLTACAIASLIITLIYIEIGSPYTYLVWICTSLLSFFFFSGSVIWVEYLLVFGIYPVLKALIERLPRVIWIVPKLVYINAVIFILMLVMERLLLIPFFTVDNTWVKVGVWCIINVAFLAYDLFITVLVRLYLYKYRKIFARFFK